MIFSEFVLKFKSVDIDNPYSVASSDGTENGLCTILNDPDFCIIFICCAYWLDGLCFFAVSISEL